MTRITTSDQVLALLRSHLERARRTGGKTASRRGAQPGPIERVQQLAATEGLSESEIAQALIAGLLSEEFGPEVAVEPKFQAMVAEIRQMLERDPAGKALLQRAIGALAGGT